jgi:hypothetical protein
MFKRLFSRNPGFADVVSETTTPDEIDGGLTADQAIYAKSGDFGLPLLRPARRAKS